MKRLEQQLHIAVAKYLALMLPVDAWWTTIPAGGGGARRGAFIKAMGYRKGTPDILIVFRGLAHFVELKADEGKASASQHDAMREIIKAGGHSVICRSIDEVQLALGEWRIPTRLAA